MHFVSNVVFEALDVLLVGLLSKQLRQIIIHRNSILFSVFSLAWFQKLEPVLLIEWDGFFLGVYRDKSTTCTVVGDESVLHKIDKQTPYMFILVFFVHS